MLVKLFLYSSVLIISVQIYGQSKQTVEEDKSQWIGRTYGGDKIDRGIFVNNTTDGALLTIGFSESFSSSNDVYVLKTDYKGEVLWQKNIGGNGGDVGWSFVETDAGKSYLIAGFSDSYGTDEDILLVKMTSNGEVQWIKNLPRYGDERCWSIKKVSDGNFILIGQTRDSLTKNYDGMITKVDSDGNLKWQRKYGGTRYERLFYSEETSRGDIIVTGIVRNDSLSENSGLVILTDHLGNQLVSRELSNIKNITTHGVLSISRRRILIYGYAQTDTTREQRAIYMALFNNNAELKREKVVKDGNLVNHGLTAIKSRNNAIVMTGYTKLGLSDDWNGVIYKYTTKGRLLLRREFGGKMNDQPYSLVETPLGELMVTGVTNSYGYGGGDLWLVKLDSKSLHIRRD